MGVDKSTTPYFWCSSAVRISVGSSVTMSRKLYTLVTCLRWKARIGVYSFLGRPVSSRNAYSLSIFICFASLVASSFRTRFVRLPVMLEYRKRPNTIANIAYARSKTVVALMSP